MLGWATHQALRIHEGEELPSEQGALGGEYRSAQGVPGGEYRNGEDVPGGEYLPGWDDFPQDAEPSPMYARPRPRLAVRGRRHLRGVGVGIVVAIPAMLVTHALIARLSGPTRSRPALGAQTLGALASGAQGGSLSTVAAKASEAPEAAVRRASLPPRLTSPARREGASYTYARTGEAGSVASVVVAAAPVVPARATTSAGGSVERTSASASPEFGFER